MSRVCKVCAVTKPLTAEFFFSANKGRNFRGICKPCYQQQAADWCRRNAGKVQTYMSRWREKQPTKVASPADWARANARARPWVRRELTARHTAKGLGVAPRLTPVETRRLRVYYHMARLSGMVIDHIKALRDGGLHHPDNVQLLSFGDNVRKGHVERAQRKSGGQ